MLTKKIIVKSSCLEATSSKNLQIQNMLFWVNYKLPLGQ